MFFVAYYDKKKFLIFFDLFRIDSVGTRGRKCDPNSFGENGCDEMCCGRGYKSETRKVIERCNCKFVYCCKVICEKCEMILKEHFCR